MTDIWDEKPDIMWKPYEGIRVYMALDMNAWLEKLKAHYVPIEEKADAMLRYRKAAEDLGEFAADLKDKLEAIRDKVAEWDSTHMRDRHAAPSILMDLEKILGVEG